MKPVKLQEWANANKPEEDLIWGKRYWDQIMFVRDELTEIFPKSYEEYQSIRSDLQVISTHKSKSVLLPVFKMTTDNFTFIMRYNFYDWKISVEAKEPISLDFGRLVSDTSQQIYSCYLEGFKDEWAYECYDKNKSKFTIEVRDNYKLFTLLWMLNNAYP